jgi:hypothetical protein
MNLPSNNLITSPWQLFDSSAHLQTSLLQANVNLLQPALGLHGLSWNEISLPGNLLGVTVAEEATNARSLSTTGLDDFVRGVDLVANYPQTETQHFTLHIYWRVPKAEANLVIVDAILSLQTSLLECFPKAILTTELPASDAWLVSGDGSPPMPLLERFESVEAAGVLLRGVNRAWSYFEMTHPDDLGSWRIEAGASTKMQRELGGEFQEKGVIRRLRTRGAFLSCENDLEVAARLREEFAASPPPLTA